MQTSRQPSMSYGYPSAGKSPQGNGSSESMTLAEILAESRAHQNPPADAMTTADGDRYGEEIRRFVLSANGARPAVATSGHSRERGVIDKERVEEGDSPDKGISTVGEKVRYSVPDLGSNSVLKPEDRQNVRRPRFVSKNLHEAIDFACFHGRYALATVGVATILLAFVKAYTGKAMVDLPW